MHIVYAARASCHAGITGETAIEMRADLPWGRVALEHGFDKVNTPSRAIPLVSKKEISWARGVAKSAMDATAQNVVCLLEARIFELL
jgi:hypothetical protein